MELFDSHAHYDDEKFNEDRDFIINEIYKSGVTKFVSAGYSLESSKIGIELAKKYDFIYTTSGISPNDIPATNVFAQYLDEHLDDDYLKMIFPHMTNVETGINVGDTATADTPEI